MSEDAKWFTGDKPGKQPGDKVGRANIYVATSLKAAVAYFRHSGLSLYQVEPLREPVASDLTPGLSITNAATVVAPVDDPGWPNDELWQLVSGACWQGAIPMYDEDGYVTRPPQYPKSEDAESVLKSLKTRQHVLPAAATKYLRPIMPGDVGWWY
jgi:hypothetical protein